MQRAGTRTHIWRFPKQYSVSWNPQEDVLWDSDFPYGQIHHRRSPYISVNTTSNLCVFCCLTPNFAENRSASAEPPWWTASEMQNKISYQNQSKIDTSETYETQIQFPFCLKSRLLTPAEISLFLLVSLKLLLWNSRLRLPYLSWHPAKISKNTCYS